MSSENYTDAQPEEEVEELGSPNQLESCEGTRKWEKMFCDIPSTPSPSRKKKRTFDVDVEFKVKYKLRKTTTSDYSMHHRVSNFKQVYTIGSIKDITFLQQKVADYCVKQKAAIQNELILEGADFLSWLEFDKKGKKFPPF